MVTISELRYGVLVADEPERRATRLRTLETARQLASPLPIDEPVGDELARLRAALRSVGRSMKVMDAWIAATAMAYDAAVYTQDADFEAARATGLVGVVQA